MDNNVGKFTHWYTTWVLNRPFWTIAILILVVGVLGYQARNFRIDIPWLMWHKNSSGVMGESFYTDPSGFDGKNLIIE